MERTHRGTQRLSVCRQSMTNQVTKYLLCGVASIFLWPNSRNANHSLFFVSRVVKYTSVVTADSTVSSLGLCGSQEVKHPQRVSWECPYLDKHLMVRSRQSLDRRWSLLSTSTQQLQMPPMANSIIFSSFSSAITSVDENQVPHTRYQ